jgi:hypothetical protein
MRNIDFDVAEVLAYDYTYQYIPPTDTNSTVSQLFALKVRSCSSYYNNQEFIVKPSNINLKQIPLVGEFVLIYKTFNQQSNSSKWREQWYYVTSVDIHSSMNENMLPGLSDGLTQDQIDEIKPGDTFIQKSISPLQPYEGDFLFEGRWGNTLRLGSTVNLPGKYTIEIPWKGTSNGDPIIVLSNGKQHKPNKQFVAEDVQRDASSLYLTSTQKIPKLLLGDSNSKNPLSSYLSESQFADSQFIGVADRIVLKAKSDIVVIDSPKAIVLNTTGEIKLGNDTASESMVHGDVLVTILQKLINQMLSGVQIGDTYAPTTGYSNGAAYALEAQQLLQELLSSKYFIQKNTY